MWGGPVCAVCIFTGGHRLSRGRVWVLRTVAATVHSEDDLPMGFCSFAHIILIRSRNTARISSRVLFPNLVHDWEVVVVRSRRGTRKNSVDRRRGFPLRKFFQADSVLTFFRSVLTFSSYKLQSFVFFDIRSRRGFGLCSHPGFWAGSNPRLVSLVVAHPLPSSANCAVTSDSRHNKKDSSAF